MPTYEYLCKRCGTRFEKVQPFSARPLKTHDACGGEVQKVFHASGVVFKGSGFYATDNRSPAAASASTKGEADSNGSTDAKKESADKAPTTKPETKKETPAAAAAD